MSVRLPKENHKPVVGNRVEKSFACIYLAAPKSAQQPVKIGFCEKLGYFKKLPSSLELKEIFWTPDLRLARRLYAGALILMRAWQVRELSDGSFNTTVKRARYALVESASSGKIPMLKNEQYRKLLKSPAGQREAEQRAALRSLGVT
jgi:hypothetical protein